jgi:DNA repair protein RadC
MIKEETAMGARKPPNGPCTSELPLRDQPAYRIANNKGSCSMVELLAVVIGGPRPVEVSTALLCRYKSSLPSLTVEEMREVQGIGQIAACRILAAIELGRRLTGKLEDRPSISSPAAAATLLTPLLGGKEQEYLYVILLDSRNRVMGEPILVYKGSVNTSLIRTAEVVRPAVRANASGILIAHSHPSGDPSPSPEDVSVTRSIVEAAKLMDLTVVDHLILGQGNFVSLRERGLMP